MLKKKKKSPSHKTKHRKQTEALGELFDSCTRVNNTVSTNTDEPDRKLRAALAAEDFLKMKRGQIAQTRPHMCDPC